ncbi:MAG: ATP synthase subunit I [Clostridiales bacterium]|nr:ATP synthase subunit I [Clostridiales bacterium]
MDEGKQTFIELLAGIIFLGVLLLIPGIIWPYDKAAYYLGLLIGVIISLYLTYDMYSSLGKGLTMEEKAASGYIRKRALLRLLVILVVFFIAAYTDKIQIFSVLLGALTLKFSAYLQPLTHKFLAKNK